MSDKIERAQFGIGERVETSLDIFFKLFIWTYLYKNNITLELNSSDLVDKVDGIMPSFDIKTVYEDEDSLEGKVSIRAILVPDEILETKGVIH